MAHSPFLQSDKVRSLSTKYFYKENRMHFLITLVYGEDGVLLKEFDNYDAYRNDHDFLVKALNSSAGIPNNFTSL
jgi:hypothetical protein